MTKLKPDRIREESGLRIFEKIIPWGSCWNKNVYHSGKVVYKKGAKYKADRLLSNNTGKVKGITIHNTNGNADAETYTRATFPNQNMLSARVHFYVDDKEIWQNLREDEVGWHAGDGRGPGNDTTISIEILLKGKAVSNGKKAEYNGAKLTALLLNKYNLGVKNVYPHKHWSGKNCPINILPHWNEFLKEVQNHLNKYKQDPLYRVQIGAFKDYQNAKVLKEKLSKLGFEAFIKN